MHEQAKEQLQSIVAISAILFKNYDQALPYEGQFFHAAGFDKPLFTELNEDREMRMWLDGDVDNYLIIDEENDWRDLIGMAEDLGAIDAAKAEALRELPV